jgi:hypothetical protein
MIAITIFMFFPRCAVWNGGVGATLDHDDFGLNQSKIMNVSDSNNPERDAQISLRRLRKLDPQISSRNLRKLDCVGKPVPTFPHPALGSHRGQ